MVNNYRGCSKIWTLTDVVQIKADKITKVYFENNFGCIKSGSVEIYKPQIDVTTEDISAVEIIKQKNSINAPLILFISAIMVVASAKFEDYNFGILILITSILLVTVRWKTYYLQLNIKSVLTKVKINYSEIEDATIFVRELENSRSSKNSD